MRLSKKFWIILGIGAFVVLAAILATTYFDQVGERTELEDSLALAEKRLPGLTSEKEDLENELAQARSSVSTGAAKYPQDIHSIEYGEYLFEIVGKSNVTLASLSFPKPSASKVGSVSYSTVSLTLPISGSRADIFQFIQTIRTDSRFASTRINSISMSGGSATISVTIYAYNR